MSDHQMSCSLFERFQQELRVRGYARQTIKTYTSALRAYVRWLSPLHPREADADRVRAYLLHLLDRGHSRAWLGQTISALRFLYGALYGWSDTRFDVPRPRRGRFVPSVPTREQILSMADAVSNRKHRLTARRPLPPPRAGTRNPAADAHPRWHRYAAAAPLTPARSMPTAPLNWNLPASDLPLAEPLLLHDGIACLESHLPQAAHAAADLTFLRSLPPAPRCAQGAADRELHPFIAIPIAPLGNLPNADIVLQTLHASSFKSAHIPDLARASLPHPGYHPYSDIDEIHTDDASQYMLPVKDDQEDERSDDDLRRGLQWFWSLKQYVHGGHLYHVVLHTRRRPAGTGDVADAVLLFAVGVSPATGNLVGAVTCQLCHNLCD